MTRRPSAVRHLTLPDGRACDIRPATGADVDGLAVLFARLDSLDRHHRFFSAFRPSRPFLERLVTVADRGGLELVATTTARDGAEQVVGEAGYSLLPNGDGELGITVADAWRGQLGHHLLDALLEAAAARGVPNLEAGVFTDNEPMLALARARGAVTMAEADWGVVRLLIGTGRHAPTWPGGHERPRVLVEGPSGHWHQEEAAAAGLEVLVCPGPDGRRERCPALAGQPCPLAAGADAIVLAHPPDDPEWRSLLEVHHEAHPGVPVCVELAPGDAVPAPDVVAQVPAGADGAQVVAFVRRLARAGQERHLEEGP